MVGEQIVSVVVKELLRKLGSPLWEEIRLLWNFRNDLRGMNTTLESIQAVLNDAEKQSFNNASVRLWLKRLKAAAYDVEDMLDQFQTQNQSNDLNNFFSIFMQFFSLVIMACRLKAMRTRLDNIAAERSNYNLRGEITNYSLREKDVTNSQEVIEGRRTFATVNRDNVLGRGEEATKIINRLLSPSDAISIIPIVGIGGLGKTTLAKLIFNDDRMKVFEPRIWVHAMDFKVNKMVEMLDSSGMNLRNMEYNVENVKQILNGKRYLIVLDDVWNEDAQIWEDFKQVLQGGKGDSKIIVTSRTERVPLIMHAETPHKLEYLSDKVCLELFEKRAFLSPGAKDQKLVSIGKDIAEKCKGVPLIANALGGMLQFTTVEAAWKEVRDSELWELKEVEGENQSENKIMSSLKLSYQYMSSPLKSCFIYCSLYPKASRLSKDMLIQQWIAQRFIQREHVGDNFVNHLLAISFLEETEEKLYKMHDLVYDLARSIAGDEVSVLEPKTSPNVNPKECRYASIMEYSDTLKSPRDLPRKVRALHFQERRHLPRKIFSYTKFIRVLDLSFRSFRFSVLPTSIYKLKLLRYLKLSDFSTEVDERIGELRTLEMLIISHNSHICTLPVSIGKLYNLVYLDLSFNKNLSALPDTIENLQRLRSLNLCGCLNFRNLPESLGKCTELTILNIQRCPIPNQLPNSICEMTNLEIQRGELLEFGPNRDVIELYLIDGPREAYVVWDIPEAERNNLKERGGSIKSLHYKCTHGEGQVMEDMLEALQPHQNLQELRIWEYRRSMFPRWMRNLMELFLPNLVKIELQYLPNCESLPVLGQLPKLEEIFIWEMLKVKRISEQFCGARNTTGTSFPSLKRLDLMEMLELEEWVTAVTGDGERGASLFPCLEELNIQNCPKLQIRPCIPPSVKVLNLRRRRMSLLTMLDVGEISLKHLCLNEPENLTSLPESIRHHTSLETLRIRYCESLSTLPEWLGDLSSLRCLEICDCPLIECLPESMQRLTALETLDITACSESLWSTEKEIREKCDMMPRVQNVHIIKGYPWEL